MGELDIEAIRDRAGEGDVLADTYALCDEVERLRTENACLAAEPTDDEIYAAAVAASGPTYPKTLTVGAALRAFLDGRRGAGRD